MRDRLIPLSLVPDKDPTAKRKQIHKTTRSFCGILQSLELQASPFADKLWLRTIDPYSLEGLTSQATYIYAIALSSSHFDSGFGSIRTLLMAKWINQTTLWYYVSEVPPALLCDIMNTSYAGPPKMHQRWNLRCKIHCVAVLLPPSCRASAAT